MTLNGKQRSNGNVSALSVANPQVAQELAVSRFAALDSWRGIAALLVAFGHLKTSGWLSSLLIANTSYRFVDFFFVLSGFVIAYSSAQRLVGNIAQVVRFLVRRIARLWPLHVFVLTLFFAHQTTLLLANYYGLVVSPVAFSDEFSWPYLVHNILLIQAWDLLPGPTWNKPAWSISTEMFAYLVFAAACFVAKYGYWVVLFCIFALCCIVGVVFRPEIMQATHTLALVRCVAGFSVGVFVYKIYTKASRISLRIPSVVEFLCVALTFVSIMWLPKGWGSLVLPVFGLTIFVFSLERGVVSAFLRKPLFVFLGVRSYSIYLTHSFIALVILSSAAVFGVLGKLADGNTGISLSDGVDDLAIIMYLCIVVLLSSWTYEHVEVPGQEFGRSILAKVSRTTGGVKN